MIGKTIMIQYRKKIIVFCFYILSFCNIQLNSSIESFKPFHKTFVWEKYSTLPLLITLTGLSCYGIYYASQKKIIHNNNNNNNELKKFIDNIQIIHPHQKNESIIQSFANSIQLPIIMIKETYVQNNQDCLDYLFGKAYELKPCIIYIVENTEDKKCPSFAAKESFIFDLQLLQNIDQDIILLGTSKNKKFQSPEDLFTLGFNLEKNNPSYEERLEFLDFLLRKYNLSTINTNLNDWAKKTLGFSYVNLYKLITNICNVKKSYIINQSDFDKSFNTIIKSDNIYQSSSEDLYHTCVHETGHVIMTILLKNNNFTLHHASITPHYDSCQYLGKTAFTKFSLHSTSIFNRREVENKNKKINYEHIKISFAGKIAEQIIFGLSNQLPLTAKFAFEDFIKNPGNATHDLYDAIHLLHEHSFIKPIYNKYYYESHFNESSPFYTELYHLYEETLTILLPYKEKIIEAAQGLKQKEFIMASEIHTIMQS